MTSQRLVDLAMQGSELLFWDHINPNRLHPEDDLFTFISMSIG